MILIMCAASVLMLAGCGKKADDKISEDKTVINNQGDTVLKKVSKTKTFDDDTVIAFTDQRMAKDVREMIGVPEGNITYGMVKNIREYKANYTYSDISPLSYFTGLVVLNIGTENDDLNALEGLNNLETVGIDGKNLTDLSGLGDLPMLTTLSLHGCDQLTSLKWLKDSHSIIDLEISACQNLPMEEINNISNLEHLYIVNNDNLTDLSDLSNLRKLKRLGIYGCKNLTEVNCIDIFPALTRFSMQSLYASDIMISNLQNLNEISIYDCDQLQKFSLRDLSGLAELSIMRCNQLAELENINLAENLEKLDIKNCDNIKELNLNGLQNVTVIIIDHCAGLEKISGLENLQKLSQLYIEYCDGINDIRDIGDLSNLTSLIVPEGEGKVRLSISCENANIHVSTLEAYIEEYQDAIDREIHYTDESDGSGNTITMVRINKSVPLKAEPRNNARKVTAVAKGDTFPYIQTISNEYEKWYEINYLGEIVYVTGKEEVTELIFVPADEQNENSNANEEEKNDNEQTQNARTVVVDTVDGGVNIRKGPGTEYDIIFSMVPDGTEFDVKETALSSKGKEWGKVEYQGQEGWIAMSQVKQK